MPDPKPRPLTAKQRRFVEEYCTDWNGTQAAIRAGYAKRSAQQIATENLLKPVIQQAIGKELDRLTEETGVTAEKVLRELGRIAFSDLRDLFVWSEEHAAFIPSRDLTEEEAAVISEIQSETITTNIGSEEDGISETRVKLKMKTYDKLGALDKLSRHLGLFKDTVEHTGSVEVKIREVTLEFPPEEEPEE
jgi:phage terminase small subunit